MKIGFCGLLTIVLVILKATHVLDIGWLWVFAPLWIAGLVLVAILAVIGLLACIETD